MQTRHQASPALLTPPQYNTIKKLLKQELLKMFRCRINLFCCKNAIHCLLHHQTTCKNEVTYCVPSESDQKILVEFLWDLGYYLTCGKMTSHIYQ